MIQIAPFRALRYNPEKISFISRVVAPPYDLIDQAQAQELRDQDRHNVVRLILGKEGLEKRAEGEYQQAAETFAAWRREGVLIRENAPAVYVVEQAFPMNGSRYVRHGVICAMLLEEFSSKHVLPHERTMAEPKADRLRLMEACHANLSPIFGAFSDAEGRADALLREMAAGMPLCEFCRADRVTYTIWRVDDEAAIGQLASLLRDETLFIADGHHRYEAALRYREEHRSVEGPPGSAPEDFLPVFCASVSSPGLRILPTHRLVKAPGPFRPDIVLQALGEFFSVSQEPVKGPESLRQAFGPSAKGGACIGFYVSPERLYILEPASDDVLADQLPDRLPEWRRQPVTLLHYAILERLFAIPAEAEAAHPRLFFSQNVEKIYWRVESGSYDAGFLLPPTHPATVEAIARGGERMPPKSTFFFPKIASGLLFYAFDDEEGPPRIPDSR